MAQFADLEQWIVDAGAPIAGARYVDAIVAFAQSCKPFLDRGVAGDDLIPSLRITHLRKRAIIAYLVDDAIVSIVGVFYGGQNYESALGSNED